MTVARAISYLKITRFVFKIRDVQKEDGMM